MFLESKDLRMTPEPYVINYVRLCHALMQIYQENHSAAQILEFGTDPSLHQVWNTLWLDIASLLENHEAPLRDDDLNLGIECLQWSTKARISISRQPDTVESHIGSDQQRDLTKLTPLFSSTRPWEFVYNGYWQPPEYRLFPRKAMYPDKLSTSLRKLVGDVELSSRVAKS